MSFTSDYLVDVATIAAGMAHEPIDKLADELLAIREKQGRLFILGVGGSAANASHAVNDFRKLCDIEAYTATDNVSEITARTNDEGWERAFIGWLLNNHLTARDALLVLSVGGGDAERNISKGLVLAIRLAGSMSMRILAILGSDKGYAASRAHVSVIVPCVNDSLRTPHSEEFQSVILHLLVSHPKLKMYKTKWESIK